MISDFLYIILRQICIKWLWGSLAGFWCHDEETDTLYYTFSQRRNSQFWQFEYSPDQRGVGDWWADNGGDGLVSCPGIEDRTTKDVVKVRRGLTAQCRSGVALLRSCSWYWPRPTSLPLLLHGIHQTLRLLLTRWYQIALLPLSLCQMTGSVPKSLVSFVTSRLAKPPSVRDIVRQKLPTNSGEYSEQDREFSLMTSHWAGPSHSSQEWNEVFPN